MSLVIGWEPFASMWPDAKDLITAHFNEVEGDLAINRPCGINHERLNSLDEMSVMRCATARAGGRLVGYMTWMLMPDVESFDTLMATQGGIYVAPDAPRSGMFGLSYYMLRFCIPALRFLGVKFLFLHHRLRGRGKNLGMLFKRFGATEIKHEYYLWIGG